MVQEYYIDSSGTKDGPHDLVTIMRRIRSGKIGPDTRIFTDDAGESIPASQIPDIALFFSKGAERAPRDDQPKVVLPNLLRDSIGFTFEHNIMTVYAGAIALLSILLAAGMIAALGSYLGGMLSWIVFVALHYIFFIFTLRMYRMQPFSVDFMSKQFAPVVPALLFSAIVQAMMMVGGFLLLVLPALVVAVYYAFVPFFIFDRRMTMIEAMVASRLLVQKHNKRYQKTIATLIIMHVGALVLIFPFPVTMPMFAAALAKIYEELSIS